MKKTLMILFITYLACANTLAQFKNKEVEKKMDNVVLEQVKSIYTERLKLSKKQNQISKEKLNEYVPVDKKQRLFVTIRIKYLNTADELKNLGCEIVQKGTPHGNIQDVYLWVPYDSLESVANLENVILIDNIGIKKKY